MAKPSCLVSLATRLFSLNGFSISRSLHISRGTASAVVEQLQDLNEDSLDRGSTVFTDVETDDALVHKDFFGVEKLFTVRKLFDARVHYGHKKSALNERMKQFVFGVRCDQVIFDLDITALHLRQALNFAAHIALRGGLILFVSRTPQNSFTIEETAKQCGAYSHTRKWLGSELTNSTIHYGAVTRLPELLIFFSTLSEIRKQHPAVSDAAKMNIPTIGIVDSNCCPNLITYPVPGNDDSISSVELYCQLFKEAILLGKKERERRFEEVLQEEQDAQKS